MHHLLTGLFEGAVLGVAIALLIASLELRNPERWNHIGNRDEERDPTPDMGRPLYAGPLAGQPALNRATESEIERPQDHPADHPNVRPFPIGLTLHI